MPLLHLSLPPHRLLVGRRCRLFHPPTPPPSRLSVRAAASASAAAAETYGLPFQPERASHHRELAAAAAAVERACRLCVDVKSLLLSGDKRILEKNDQSPVTIADFGVQALISLELQQLFPSIPLVAEEDSAFLRLTSTDDNSSNVLVESISSAVADKVNNNDSPLTHDDVLRAIDRGGKDAVFFDSNPATYWVLDPIDGTKGFLKGDDAMYVVWLSIISLEGSLLHIVDHTTIEMFNAAIAKECIKLHKHTPFLYAAYFHMHKKMILIEQTWTPEYLGSHISVIHVHFLRIICIGHYIICVACLRTTVGYYL